MNSNNTWVKISVKCVCSVCGCVSSHTNGGGGELVSCSEGTNEGKEFILEEFKDLLSYYEVVGWLKIMGG